MVSNVQLVETARLARLLKEREKLQRENGLMFYSPHAKQDLFHRSGGKKYRYVRTGNRFGKSYCGAAEDLAWARGERVWYPKDDEARYVGIPQRPTKGVILVHDWGKAKEIFTSQEAGGLGKLFQFMPKDWFAGVEKENGGNISAVKVKSVWGGVSVIYLDTVKSFLTNPMGHESSNWDYVHVDEPIPEDMWKAYARGLMDSDGKAWFLCTPLNQPWINDFFVPGRRTTLKLNDMNEFGKKVVIVGGTSDNPFITDEAREDYAELLTKEEKLCRLQGIPLSMSGLVYKEFVPDVHVLQEVPKGWKDYQSPPENYTLRYAIDPHPRTPHAVLFAATAPSGEVFFFHEIFDRLLLKDLAYKIRSVIDGRHVLGAIIDPSAFIENPIDGSTMADELGANGVFCERAPKDLRFGIQMVQSALRERDVRGRPRLYFSPYLAETLWEFDHYEWQENKSDKPVDRNDHMMENLYRLVLCGLDWVDPHEYTGTYIPQGDARYGGLLVPQMDVPAKVVEPCGVSAEEQWDLMHL